MPLVRRALSSSHWHPGETCGRYLCFSGIEPDEHRGVAPYRCKVVVIAVPIEILQRVVDEVVQPVAAELWVSLAPLPVVLAMEGRALPPPLRLSDERGVRDQVVARLLLAAFGSA